MQLRGDSYCESLLGNENKKEKVRFANDIFCGSYIASQIEESY